MVLSDYMLEAQLFPGSVPEDDRYTNKTPIKPSLLYHTYLFHTYLYNPPPPPPPPPRRGSAHPPPSIYRNYPPHGRYVEIGVKVGGGLGGGGEPFVVLGSDLTKEYVEVNADYRS
jgi:hypothetical protein